MTAASMPARIPFFDASTEIDMLWEPILAAVTMVLRSGQYILGSQVGEFERSLATWLGSGYAAGVASGTDALYLALAARGIGPGDEVITSPFAFVATVEAIVRVGAHPVFADVDPKTLNLDPVAAKSAITGRTAAIMAVHIFGQPCDMDAFCELAGEHGLFLLEDASQAVGGRWRGRCAGTVGDAAAVSFFPAKTLGAAGDGGAVLTANAEVDQRVRSLRTHGAQSKYQHAMLGTNSRLDELQAAVLNAKIAHLDAWILRRRAVARTYDEALRSAACVPLHQDARAESAFSQYTIRVPGGRDALASHLLAAGIGSAVHYPRPLHLQPALAMLRYRAGDFPVAEQACREVLSLPCYPGLLDSAVSQVADAIGSWQAGFRR